MQNYYTVVSPQSSPVDCARSRWRSRCYSPFRCPRRPFQASRSRPAVFILPRWWLWAAIHVVRAGFQVAWLHTARCRTVRCVADPMWIRRALRPVRRRRTIRAMTISRSIRRACSSPGVSASISAVSCRARMMALDTPGPGTTSISAPSPARKSSAQIRLSA